MSEYPKVHVSITVSDLDRSIDFYTRFFGDKPVKTKPGYAKFLPSFAPLNLALELSLSKQPHTGLMEHMGIQVADQGTVLAHLKRVKDAGLPTHEEMNVDCCHANQDKFWVKDPDGAQWEIYVLNHDIEEPESSSACCQEQAVLIAEKSEAACCAPACCG